MKSKKPLIITIVSVFAIVGILIGVLFAVLSTYSRYQYAQTLKLSAGKHSKDDRNDADDSRISAIAKVTFLIGNSRYKKRKDKNWEKLRFGQKLSRGDSIRVGSESKLELTLKNEKTITIEGYKKLRIDGSLLRTDSKSLVGESSSSEGSEKISRLTGKEGNEKETTPVSAIRSNEPPPKKNDKKSSLKTRIGE